MISGDPLQPERPIVSDLRTALMLQKSPADTFMAALAVICHAL